MQRFERPLIDFAILGPLAALGPARPFAVRLELDAPRESVQTRYVVMGEDPLWVFGQDDYERILHWEHKMGQEALDQPARAVEPPPAHHPEGPS